MSYYKTIYSTGLLTGMEREALINRTMTKQTYRTIKSDNRFIVWFFYG